MGTSIVDVENFAAACTLREQFAAPRNNFIALLGAGASRPAYPSWGELIDEMQKRAMELAGERAEEIRSWDYVKDPPMRAQYYRQFFKTVADYHNFLEGQFGTTCGPTELSREIASLKVEHFLTTNYEDLMCQADNSLHRCSWNNSDQMRPFFAQLAGEIGPVAEQKRYYIHLHGRIDDPASIIFTEQDYLNLYVRSEVHRRKLFVLFSMKRILFIGFSLSDPDLMVLQRESWAMIDARNARHFAIIPWDSKDDGAVDNLRPKRKLFREKFGIEPIFYPVTDDPPSGYGDNRHWALIALLRFLRGEACDTSGLQPLSPPSPAASASRAGAASPPKPSPGDPEKGQWGGKSNREECELTASVTSIKGYEDWFKVVLTVSGKKEELRGFVRFHLHPSFYPRVRHVRAKQNKAQLDLEAWGAFTVGVETKSGTKLELDLADVEGAPPLFRQR